MKEASLEKIVSRECRIICNVHSEELDGGTFEYYRVQSVFELLVVHVAVFICERARLAAARRYTWNISF